jgi:hypothetical protein
MTNPEYRRVVKRRSLGRAVDLWIADDHLLLVNRYMWTETYRRFRLREIQSIVVSERTQWRMLQFGGLAVTVIVLGLVLALSGFWWSVPLLVIGTIQVIDVLRGSYCRAYLNTAASTAPLAAISRMNQATQFLAAIEPLIVEAQADLAPPPMPVEEEHATGFVFDTVQPVEQPPELPAKPDGPLPYLMFGGAILLGIFGLVLFYGKLPGQAVVLGMMLSFAICAVAGIVAFGAVGRPPAILRVLGVLLVLVGVVDIVFSFAAYFIPHMEAITKGQPLIVIRPPWVNTWGLLLPNSEIVTGLIGSLLTVYTRRRK